VRELALKLEQLGKSGDLHPAAAIVGELSASFERARGLMEQFCQAALS